MSEKSSEEIIEKLKQKDQRDLNRLLELMDKPEFKNKLIEILYQSSRCGQEIIHQRGITTNFELMDDPEFQRKLGEILLNLSRSGKKFIHPRGIRE